MRYQVLTRPVTGARRVMDDLEVVAFINDDDTVTPTRAPIDTDQLGWDIVECAWLKWNLKGLILTDLFLKAGGS